MTPKLTKEQIRFLRRGYRRMTIAELTAAFVARFGIEKTESQIRCATRNHGMKSGRTGCFEKGLIPWNKGRKGYMGANKTSFKKGNCPPNLMPLGSERIDSKDGFVLVKIKERDPHTGCPTRYKHKHVHVWEKKHGPVPAGFVVAFKDSDKQNCKLRNLMLISRAELLSLNLHGYGEMPDKLKPSVLALAKLEAKAGIRTRHARGRERRSHARAKRIAWSELLNPFMEVV